MGSNLSYVPIDMTGKVCLITGGNTGIGFVTAKHLVKMHCHVFLACRNESKALEAIKRIKDETQADHIEFIQLDLSSLQSVRQCAQTFKARGLPLHLLINNAGTVANSRQLTVDGHETVFSVNHLGHFLLTNLLLDVIVSSAPARIINVSSVGHTYSNLNFEDLQMEKNYSAFTAYCNTKLMNIFFTIELQRRLDSKQVVVHSLHPGFVDTEIINDIGGFVGFLTRAMRPAFAITPEQGAMTTLFVATDPNVANVGGKYFDGCKEVAPNRKANDPEAPKKLWEISEKLAGVNADSVEGQSSSNNNNDNKISNS